MDRFWQGRTNFGNQNQSGRATFAAKNSPGGTIFAAKIGLPGPVLGGTDFTVTHHLLLATIVCKPLGLARIATSFCKFLFSFSVHADIPPYKTL